MAPPIDLKTEIYQILETAPSDHRISRLVRRVTILLVCLNTLALMLSYVHVLNPNPAWLARLIDLFSLNSSLDPSLDPRWISSVTDFLKANQTVFFLLVEALSTACFGVAYLLRLWSAPAGQRYRGRIRFGLRPLMLIDLAAILPLVVLLFTPSRELTIRVLRLGWCIRHLKLIRYWRRRPVLDTSLDRLLQETEAQLETVRQQVAKGREQDLARVNRSIDAVSRQCQSALMLEPDGPSPTPRQPSPLPHLADAAPSPLLSLLDDLEADLTHSVQMDDIAELVSAAYQDSAGVFDDVPRRAPVDVALDADGQVGQKHIPLRQIGRSHFRPMATRYTEIFGARHLLYAEEVRRDVLRIRTAMAYALEQEDAQEAAIGLNRAISQIRDLDSPVRLAWDDLLFQIEEDHQKRLHIVRADIERYGSPWFHLGRLQQWCLRRLQATRRLLDIPKRLWIIVLRWLGEGVKWMLRFLRPALLRLGLIKTPTLELLRALDQARLDSVYERGLPAEYLAHFDFAAVEDEGVFLGLDEEFANISLAINRWQDNHQSSFIIYGHRGVGKSSLVNMAQQRLFKDHHVIHHVITQKLTTTELLVHYLAQLLGFPQVERFEDLASALLAESPRVVWLEDCHHLFFRDIGGLEAIRYLFWLIAKTNHHILWGISLDKSSYDFLNQALPLSELFHVQIGLETRSGEDLRRLIMMRHNRSGISLHYVHNRSNAKALRRQAKLLRAQHRFGRANLQQALELTFFEGLAAACAGNITVAMFYWLRSLQQEDADRCEVQPFEALDLSLIWEFSQTQAFILVGILQHGKLTATELAKILDTDEIDMRLELEILTNHNVLLLDIKTDTFEVNPVVLKMVCEMLESRSLLL